MKNLFNVALREVEDTLVFTRDRNKRTSTSIPKLGVEGDISICINKKNRTIGRVSKERKKGKKKWEEERGCEDWEEK